jgi:isocitrate/isopropylmalate dehydrogenase
MLDDLRGTAGRSYPVAVIPGDGIGPELVAAALAVLDAAAAEFGFTLDLTEVSAGAGAYQRDGTAMTAQALAAVRQARATLKGPVGLPEVRRPDGTEAGVLGGVLRGGLDLYASVRPVQLLPGVPSRLKAEPDSIDYVIVRENTEGLYLSRGGAVVHGAVGAEVDTAPEPARDDGHADGHPGRLRADLPVRVRDGPARRPTGCAG